MNNQIVINIHKGSRRSKRHSKYASSDYSASHLSEDTDSEIYPKSICPPISNPKTPIKIGESMRISMQNSTPSKSQFRAQILRKIAETPNSEKPLQNLLYFLISSNCIQSKEKTLRLKPQMEPIISLNSTYDAGGQNENKMYSDIRNGGISPEHFQIPRPKRSPMNMIKYNNMTPMRIKSQVGRYGIDMSYIF